MATAAARPQPVEIPNKLYFRIGEVSRLAAVKASVLRYWETEFPQLAPKKSGANQRLYRRKDVELVFEIKRLLYDKRFTIEGARAHLLEQRQAQREALKPARPAQLQGHLFAPDPERAAAVLSAVRRELKQILALLA